MSAYIIDNETMEIVVFAYGHFMRDTQYSSQEIGNILYKLNNKAVNHRYNEHSKASKYCHKDLPQINPLSCYKAVQTLIYQCSEGTVMKTEIGIMLRELLALIADKIIRSM